MVSVSEWKQQVLFYLIHPPHIGGGDRGAMPPHFYGTIFARKDRATLIEQPQYSEIEAM